MNLYRIDLTDAQGFYIGSVSDVLGPVLVSKRATADGLAIKAVRVGQRAAFAHIIRIQGAGAIRRVGIVATSSITVGRANDTYLPSTDAPRR